ncbi:hypothetical protein [Christiangramia forsetii]|uniref:Uncharacterized protein n=2 Tax=Christiangramia forsetii TaxID=411153 RepID=A0LYB5_CHRFK|nr:hypothetical protein [Christiangramia forsetii]GGG34632.1 hypothetical protein GCM10011532_17880 [Christiangramia forsetii]CAL65360.1 hypothetical protein GFO_0375 [Christiangramia forsetii KT0803]
MAAYFNSNQLRTSLQELVKVYISECQECKMLPQDCIDLLRHNFLAEFVSYDNTNNTIEIGMNKSEDFDGYPEIEIYTFPLADIGKKVDYSFKNNNEDLEFYGKIIGRRKGIGSNSVVLME